MSSTLILYSVFTFALWVASSTLAILQIPKSPLFPITNNYHREYDITLGKKSPFFPFYSPSPAHFLKKSQTSTLGWEQERDFDAQEVLSAASSSVVAGQAHKGYTGEEVREEGCNDDTRRRLGRKIERFVFSKEFTNRLAEDILVIHALLGSRRVNVRLLLSSGLLFGAPIDGMVYWSLPTIDVY